MFVTDKQKKRKTFLSFFVIEIFRNVHLAVRQIIITLHHYAAGSAFGSESLL